MALNLDGSSQYINFGNVLDSVFAGADKKFSISLWLQLNDITSADKWLIGKYDRDSNKRSWLFYIGDTANFGDTLVFLWALGDASASRTVKASTAINSTSNIYHIVLTYDGSIDTNDGLDRPDFYINGVKESKSLRTSSGVLPDIPTTTGLLSIGAELDASGNPHSSVPKYLPAKVWDVRVYNRVLSANEIAEIYHKRGADRVWQGLVGRWRLDELSSGTPASSLLDSMDSTTGWNAGQGTLSLNTTTYQEGSGAINLTKNYTKYDWAELYRTIAAVDLTNKTIAVWAYVKDSTTLAKLSSLAVEFGQNTDNRYYKNFYSLTTGWNNLSEHVDNFSVLSGSPTKTNVTWISCVIVTNNASDTTSVGDIIFDFYRTSDYVPNSIIDLSGNGNHGTPHGGTYQASPHRLRRGVLVS